MSTELQPIDRARTALASTMRAELLTEMVKDSAAIVEITNADGRKECHAARIKLKNTRVLIAKAGKSAREDAAAFAKAVIAEEARLIGLIEPEESRLQAVQDRWDDAIAAEKAAKEKSEVDRAAAIVARIDAVRNLPVSMLGATSEAIAGKIHDAKGVDFSDIEGPARIVADKALADALERLQQMHDAAVASELEAVRLAEQRAELERLAAEQAERDRIAAEARAEADRIAAEERARLAAEAKATADAEEAERRARQEHEDAERAAAQAEADRIAVAARAAQEAAFKAEQARQQAEMAEKQRQLREQQEALAQQTREQEERARAEREAKEAAERAEREAREAAEREAVAAREKAEAEAAAAERERAIREATLVEAASEAETLLIELGYADHIVTLKLGATLRRETE
jgi:hypothetical protein